MKNDARRQIKRALYEYPKMLKESAISTVEWAESNMAVNFSKVNVQSTSVNSKETQLCRILDDNLLKVRWCYMVEKVLDHYRFEQGKVRFIKLYYFDKKSEVETCLNVGMGRATLFRWQTEILDIAYKWAKELRLV